MAPDPTRDRWHRLEELFQQTIELNESERPGFLAESCGDDLELRREVEALLASANQTNEFIEQPLRKAAALWSETQAAFAPGTRLGHYEIVSLIGSGGMGRVYLARDTKLGRKVALKTLAANPVYDGRALRRFEEEARAASALNHPNILTIYEVDQKDRTHFIVSEFVNGPNLRERLSSGRLEVRDALGIALQMAAALLAAHSVGMTHRDIKPENVMIREDGLVKVVDFGIAKLSDPPSGENPPAPQRSGVTTQPGMVMGTARYMSPEQVRGWTVDGRSDIFSFGTVLYEMVCGRIPFEGATQSDVMAEILKTDPPPLDRAVPGVPRSLSGIVARSLAKDREARYQTARDLLTDLQALQKELETGSAPQPVVKSRRGKPWLGKPWLVAALAALVLLPGAYLYWLSRAKPPAPTARTLAILPFRAARPDPATDFLGFSLADAVITKLGYVSSLTVRPSSAIDPYRNKAVDPRQVGRELNVQTLLTGSFLKDGENLRINAQLVDLQPLRIIWDDTIDLKYEDLLTVQDRVAQKIISGLELTLAPVEGQRLNSDRPISRAAYEMYLRGVDLYAANDFDHAIAVLEQSAAMAPDYALTWAQLGRAYTTKGGLQFGGREQYRKAQTAYEKALALDRNLIEAKAYMGNLLTDTGRAEQAIPLVREALAANPNYAEAHWELGYAYRYGGMLPESVAECERARQLDPNVKITSSALNAYFYRGEYDKFLASLPNVDAVYILFYRGLGEYYKGGYAEAQSLFDRAFQKDPTLLPVSVGKALADGLRHENSAGLKLLHEAENRVQERGVSDGEGIYKLSQAYAVLGDGDSAMRLFRKSIDGGFYPYSYFVADPLLANLRNRRDFSGLMDEAHTRSENFRHKFAR